MKFVQIGSCLSSLTLSSLFKNYRSDTGYEDKVNGIYSHLRSDFINELLDENDEQYIGCPLSEVDGITDYLQPMLSNKNEHAMKMLASRIAGQSKNKLEKLKSAIYESNILVFDNNYDLGRHRYDVRFNNKVYRFSNLNIPEGEFVKVWPELSSDEIINHEFQLLNKICSINSSIQIFVINYPVTAFERRASEADLIRVTNARKVGKHIKEGIDSGLLPENIQLINCIDLPDHLLSNKGPLYFEDVVYETFANIIHRKLAGSENGCYFSDFSILSKRLETAPQSVRHSGKNPYVNLPDRQYWKPAVTDPYPLSITDLYRKKFDIAIDDGVATCGSCFAQHIGKRLVRKGYKYLDFEPAPANFGSEVTKSLGYGIYSARYGNVYTSRQLVQLFDRSFGELSLNEVWQNKEGGYVDPFRPNLCGNGYETADEVIQEQQHHLKQVRSMFETLDVFVFTMGLTETWTNYKTSAVYPICPGVTAGTFDPEQHLFVNLDYSTILDEMETFLRRLRDVNRSAKVLLTVSPVPLTATAEERHILISTMASKSILRAVADRLYRRHGNVDYFPSYDIIMSPPFKGMFFKNNLRSIHEEGVDYVMSHFFSEHQPQNQFTMINSALCKPAINYAIEDDEVFCDEAFLDLSTDLSLKTNPM